MHRLSLVLLARVPHQTARHQRPNTNSRHVLSLCVGLARSRAWPTASSLPAPCCARSWRAWARHSGVTGRRRVVAGSRHRFLRACFASTLLFEEMHAHLSTPPLTTTRSWNHITDQIGMFCYTGLTPEQVRALCVLGSATAGREPRLPPAAVPQVPCRRPPAGRPPDRAAQHLPDPQWPDQVRFPPAATAAPSRRCQCVPLLRPACPPHLRFLPIASCLPACLAAAWRE